jgi:tripartite-type tricarboxylate transporter receptor subunit TctC
MTLHRRRFIQLAGAATLAAPRIARADAYPSRSVRVIVPFGPGGPNDLFARLMAPRLSVQLGAQFYVENVGGAGGNIGTARVAQAPPDGYTLLCNGANFVVNPALYASVPYDPFKQFDPVTMAASSPAILTVHPSVPAQSVRQLVELIKAGANKYSYASPGTGTPPQLVGELFRLSLKLDLVHVPYKGGGEAIASTLANQTPISFGAMAPAVPLVQSGKLRALAVATKNRSQALPDVPTMTEAGFPEVEGESWFTIVAPAGTPKEIIGRLNREVARALDVPEVKERLVVLGFEAIASSPEDCATQFRRDAAKWAKVIREAGIKGE